MFGKINEKERRIIALLGAFCLFLGALEYVIPKPLPFIRLGAANLPLLLALPLSFPAFITLILIKVLGQALISGTLVSYVFLFSLAGTAASAVMMLVIYRLFFPHLIGFTGVSVCGALCSTFAQILIARALILGESALLIAPPLLAMGTLTGLLLGLFCERFTKSSRWYQAVFTENNEKNLPYDEPSQNSGETRRARNIPPSPPSVFTCAAILCALAMIFVPVLWVRLGLLCLFWLYAQLRRRAGNPVFMLIFFAGIVACTMLIPYGRLLFAWGPLRFTEGALTAGLSKAAIVQGLMLFSKTFMPRELAFPGNFGRLLSATLTTFGMIHLEKTSFTPAALMPSLDALLWKCWSGTDNDKA
ncbi:MAG: Gx transporter family protein [Spirochaetaceae bacterium]|nr:Gx transporter family protein [Spirochaetaceae bacterium]